MEWHIQVTNLTLSSFHTDSRDTPRPNFGFHRETENQTIGTSVTGGEAIDGERDAVMFRFTDHPDLPKAEVMGANAALSYFGLNGSFDGGLLQDV